MDTPDQGAPTAAPSRLEGWLTGARELLPPLALAIALNLMLFIAIPPVNHDPVLSIIAGFLGFMVGRATAKGSPP